MIKFFGSIKLLLWLFVLIMFSSLIGTLIPQNAQDNVYLNKYGESFYNFIHLLRLDNLYHSIWFIALLALLSLNIIACFFDRPVIYKKKGNFLIHLSIIIILSGGIIGAVSGEKGYIKIYEGETTQYYEVNQYKKLLPFSILLLNFSLEYYNSEPKLLIRILDKKLEKSIPVKVNTGISIKDYLLKIVKLIPDFFINEKGEIGSRSSQPGNPALLVNIKGPKGEEERWVFAFHHFAHKVLDTNIQFFYLLKGEGIPKEFTSQLRVLDGKDIFEKTIEVNSPLEYKGWKFYQSGYDEEEERYSVLQVVKDPGIPVVYTGFTLLCIGLFWSFYFRRQK